MGNCGCYCDYDCGSCCVARMYGGEKLEPQEDGDSEQSIGGRDHSVRSLLGCCTSSSDSSALLGDIWKLWVRDTDSVQVLCSCRTSEQVYGN
jgi:hypothetical protein